MVCYNPPIAPHHYLQFEPPVLLNGSNTFGAWRDLGGSWVVAFPLWPRGPSPAPPHSHCVQGYSCLVTGFQPCGTLQSCHPTTHRAVRSVSCPPPHHLQECRSEPPISQGSAKAGEPKCREEHSPSPRNLAMSCRSEATKTTRCTVGKSPAMHCRSAPPLALT